jgi:urease gamma subunit
MPQTLWSEAAAMARELGVHRVARALRLNFETLKRHARSASRPSRGGRSVADTMLAPMRADFLEVKGFAEVSRAAVVQETIVEVVACDGTRLSIRGTCASADVAAWIQAFRGRP